MPYLFTLYICIVRTDQEAILKGGLTDVSSFIDIESENEQKGSINSIYVTTFYPTTIFQNYILNTSKVNTSVDNSYVTHLTTEELSYQGKISHNASVAYSIINAYKLAMEDDNNIKLSYSFAGIRIYYYQKGLAFKVNDLITKINGISYLDEEEYKKAWRNQDIGTVFTVLRDNIEIDITLTEAYFAEQKGYINYNYYSMYDIDGTKSYPKINVSSSGTGGPSGGLLQTLSVYNQITSFDYTYGLTISGTGTMNLDSSVGAIGGIEQKIYTAYENDVDIFFCPSANYQDAYTTWLNLKHKERMKLIEVSTLADAISYLKNYVYI